MFMLMDFMKIILRSHLARAGNPYCRPTTGWFKTKLMDRVFINFDKM